MTAADFAWLTCAGCFFSRPDRIPDPNAAWTPGMRQKPRVPGYRCMAFRPMPGASGFPPVTGGSRCGCFTDRETMEQPLRRLVDWGGNVSKRARNELRRVLGEAVRPDEGTLAEEAEGEAALPAAPMAQMKAAPRRPQPPVAASGSMSRVKAPTRPFPLAAPRRPMAEVKMPRRPSWQGGAGGGACPVRPVMPRRPAHVAPADLFGADAQTPAKGGAQ